MPHLFYRHTVLLDRCQHVGQSAGAEPNAVRPPDRRVQPELRLSLTAQCVNMDWFARVALVEKQKNRIPR
jgi:hypothetical protein